MRHPSSPGAHHGCARPIFRQRGTDDGGTDDGGTDDGGTDDGGTDDGGRRTIGTAIRPAADLRPLDRPQAAGLQADWVAESETSAEVGEVLLSEGVAGSRIALQHHGAGADGLDVVFAEAGAEVTSLEVYRWGPPPDPQLLNDSVLEAADGQLDAVIFTSAPGAEAWLSAAAAAGVDDTIRGRFANGSMIAAAVGPVTAKPLRRRGIEPLQPERSRLGALVRALVGHYEQIGSVALRTVAGMLQIRARVAVLDGRVLPLSPSGLLVLRLLAEARGDVVARRLILQALPGDSQDPHAAEVAIARLREAAGCRALVRTVVKRGYRVGLAE